MPYYIIVLTLEQVSAWSYMYLFDLKDINLICFKSPTRSGNMVICVQGDQNNNDVTETSINQYHRIRLTSQIYRHKMNNNNNNNNERF